MMDIEIFQHTLSHVALGISTTLFVFGVMNYQICKKYKTFVFFMMMLTAIMWETVPDFWLTDSMYDIVFILVALIFFRAGIDRKCKNDKVHSGKG